MAKKSLFLVILVQVFSLSAMADAVTCDWVKTQDSSMGKEGDTLTFSASSKELTISNLSDDIDSAYVGTFERAQKNGEDEIVPGKYDGVDYLDFMVTGPTNATDGTYTALVNPDLLNKGGHGLIKLRASGGDGFGQATFSCPGSNK